MGKEINTLETETKVVNVYSFEAKAEVPTKVDMLTELLGQEIVVGIIKETVDKLNYLSANDAQTGPAKRWDEHIMSLHLQMLEKYPDEQRIYQLLSENIHEYSKTNCK